MDIFFPLEWLAKILTYNILHLSTTGVWAEMVVFFIYDTLKILLLLIFITHLVGWLNRYIPIAKFKSFLSSHRLFGLEYFLASGFGAVTPFCSCSSIPVIIGFVQAGIPLGVAFSFLITSPLINEVAIALFIGLFGWKITLTYIVCGMAVGMIGGYVMQKLKMEKYVISLASTKKCACQNGEVAISNARQISKEAFVIVRKVLPYIIFGVMVGAFIHGFIPASEVQSLLVSAGMWGVPLATILGVPLYFNASSVIPIIQVLVEKGVPIGTALAFMMATVGLSLPEAMMLKRVLRTKLLLTFLGVVTIGIIIIGYVINYIFTP